MKYLILLLMAVTAFASYSPQTIITDANTGATANVNSSNELDTFLSSDSNVCKETGGNLASILSALQGTIDVSQRFLNSATDSVTIAGSIVASNPSVNVVPSPVPSYATYVAGKDPSGNLQGIALNNSHAQLVDGSAVTQPVSAPSGSPVYVSVVNPAPIPSQTVTVANPYNGMITNTSASPIPMSLIAPSPVPVSAPSASPVYVSVVNQPVPSPTVTVVVASPIPSQTVTVANQISGYATSSNQTLQITAGNSTATNTAVISTNQLSGLSKAQTVDGSGNVWGPSTILSGTDYMPVVLAASGASGSTIPTQTIQIGGQGLDGLFHSFQADSANGAQKVVVIPSSYLTTYSACYTGLTVPASPTDIFYITGSNTKTITILSDQISGTETTVAMHLFQHIVRNSASSGGTCAGASITSHDQNNAAATATVQGCTTSPTSLGGQVGIIQADAFVIPASTGVDSTWPQIRNYAEPGQGQGIVLRGSSQSLAVNLTAAIGSGVLNWCVTWTEQ